MPLRGPADGLVRADETVDDLRPGGVRIIQPKDGYRFSLDPVLLCAFAAIRKGEAVADLGTGSGVIPLLLTRFRPASLVGVELQPEMADRARRSVRLNGLEGQVSIIEGDVRRIGELLPPHSFDTVFANPPYRSPQTGRRAPVAERAAARHELAGGLGDFLRSAFFLLRPGGRFYLIHLAERLAEVLAEMRREQLEPKRLRCVHSRAGERGRLVLVEGRKGGRAGLQVEPPLLIYEGREYTPEVMAMYGGNGEGC